MYLTHRSRAGSVEGFGDRDGRRGARGTQDHREVRGIGDSSESLVGSVRSLRRHARAAALAVFAVLALALPAAAQSVTTLVSNAGQSTTSANTGSADRAQAFTTGAAGATLSSVEIISGDNEGDDMAVSLCTVDSSGYPTSSCTALTAPSSFASGTLVFTDPASTTLAATTTYTLLITSPGGQDLRLTDTGSNAEETGAAAGWTIANAYHFKSSSNVWGPTGFGTSFLITIKGTLGTTNTAPTGVPTITGTAQVGQTLTAVTTGIMDADGLTSPTYTYQWIRGNGTEADIAGENSSTYTLVDADLGKTIKVKVSFTDDASHTETLTSAATVTVAADTTPPEVVRVTVDNTGSSVTLVFDEHLDEIAAEGLHLSAISLTAGAQAVTIPFADFHLQRQALALTYRYSTIKQGQTVVVSYTDPTAGDDTDTLQDVAGNDVASFTTGQSGVPAVTNNSTNNAATGEPAITGTAQAGQELTADASPIMDTDGLASVSYSYQWVRVDADGTSNEEAISGEIAATYTLTNDDVGKRIKVQVSFTDELSGLEMRTSAAYPSSGTVTTTASTTAPALLSVTVTSTPHKTTDTYGAREHIEFSMTFDLGAARRRRPTTRARAPLRCGSPTP